MSLSNEGRTVEEILGADPESLVGKTITGVKVEGKYDRVEQLRLILSDGSAAYISYWASHADDASLEMDIKHG